MSQPLEDENSDGDIITLDSEPAKPCVISNNFSASSDLFFLDLCRPSIQELSISLILLWDHPAVMELRHSEIPQ